MDICQALVVVIHAIERYQILRLAEGAFLVQRTVLLLSL